MLENIKINKSIIERAKIVSSKIDDEEVRKRTFALNIAANVVTEFLTQKGFNVDTNLSLFRIASFTKYLEIADIYIDGKRLDVRVSFDGHLFTVPKMQEKYGVNPEAYIVVNFDRTLEIANILGFISSSELEITETNSEYRFYETSILKPIEELEDFLAGVEVKQNIYSVVEHEKIKELCISFIDDEISEADKTYFIKHILACTTCRETFCNADDFDSIISHLKNYEELLNDSTLSVLSGNKAEVDTAALANMALVENAEEISNTFDDLEIEKSVEEETIDVSRENEFEPKALDDSEINADFQVDENIDDVQENSLVVDEEEILENLTETDESEEFSVEDDVLEQDNLEQVNSDEVIELNKEDNFALESNAQDSIELGQEEDLFGEVDKESEDGLSLLNFADEDPDELVSQDEEDVLNKIETDKTVDEDLLLQNDNDKDFDLVDSSVEEDDLVLHTEDEVFEIVEEEITLNEDKDLEVIEELDMTDHVDDMSETLLMDDEILLEDVEQDDSEDSESLADDVFSNELFVEEPLATEDVVNDLNSEESLEIFDESIDDNEQDYFENSENTESISVLEENEMNSSNKDKETVIEQEELNEENKEQFWAEMNEFPEEELSIGVNTEENEEFSDFDVNTDNVNIQENSEIEQLLDDDLMALLSNDTEDVPLSNEVVEENIGETNFENSQEENIESLYANVQNGSENPEQFTLEDEPISEKTVKNTKNFIVLVGLLLFLLAGSAATLFINNNKSQDNSLDNMAQDEDFFKIDENLNIKDTDKPALSQDINKSMTNSFSDKPAAITITKLSWQINEKLALENSVKEYLQIAGKNIQMNLQNDLMTSADLNFNSSVSVSLLIAPDNTLKDIQILESSGSDLIDSIISKSIKNTLKYVNVPKVKDYNSDYLLNLIINF